MDWLKKNDKYLEKLVLLSDRLFFLVEKVFQLYTINS